MENNSVLAFFAHPDDAEIMCAGTLALLRERGMEIHIATMTAGDKGSAVLTREEIALIRRSEGADSASVISGKYHCLGFEDIYLAYCRETISSAVRLIREVRPVIVFTASPSDYMVDHEMTSRIVQTACFSAGIRNMEAGGETYEFIPHLYYADAMDGKDIYGNNIHPSVFVDITSVMPVKEKMLASHRSQREWLMKHHKIDEYILSMKRFGEIRGEECGCRFAEGFRQHLGHGYPQDDILKKILGILVKEK